jgi:flagellar hook assembly protein FlgD
MSFAKPSPSVPRSDRPARGWLLCLGLLLAVPLLSSCSKKEPTSPDNSQAYSLSGRVRVVGTLTDPTGAVTGERVVNDADGVKVYLKNETTIVDSTLSNDGGYVFQRGEGIYSAVTLITAWLGDATDPLHLHTNLAFPDTIQFRPDGGMAVYPNPFATVVRMRIELPSTQQVRLEVRSIDGTRVRTLFLGTLPAGTHEVVWDGRTDAGSPVPVGTYWIVLDGESVKSYQLAFREGLSIGGAVQLRGTLFAENGAETGTRVIGDAGGVRVRLQKPGGGRDSVLTQGGRYEFGVTEPGLYRVSCRVVPGYDEAADVMVGAASVEVPDTLILEPRGALANPPNPFHDVGIGIELTLAQADPDAAITITDLSGTEVWSTSFNAAAGFYHYHWIGVNQLDEPVPPGAYWIIVDADDSIYYNLTFRE